jgi:hypothetical protein
MLMAKNLSAQSINGKKPRENLLCKVGMKLETSFNMTHERLVANSILSRLKDGEEFSQSVIRTALIDAGDLTSNGSQGLDQALQEEDSGGGQNRSISMVAANLIQLSEAAWTESC